MISIKPIIIFVIAIIPALAWLYLFLKKHRENRWLVVITFIGGMIAAKLILVYQGMWDESINLIFFKVDPVNFKENIDGLFSASPLMALFLSVIGVGVMEEYLKFWVMRLIDRNFFKSIDDVIELAIVSALGFAFFENIIYFSNNIDHLSTGGFFIFALLRVTVVTMVHVLCSGVLGYYYGMAFFSSPLLKMQQIKKKRHPVLKFLKRVLHFKKSHVYHDELFAIGLVLSMGLHALYDFVLSVDVVILGVPLFLPIIFIYFFGGFWFLSNLLKRKDLNLKLGLVGTKVMQKEDFVKLINEISEIKEEMDTGAPIKEVPEKL